MFHDFKFCIRTLSFPNNINVNELVVLLDAVRPLLFAMKIDIYTWMPFSIFLTHDRFFRAKSWKYKIQFLVTKRGQEFNPMRFSHPRPRNYGWFHLLFLTHDHFIKPEAEKRKIPFLVTKRGQKLNPIRFSDQRPRNCG